MGEEWKQAMVVGKLGMCASLSHPIQMSTHDYTISMDDVVWQDVTRNECRPHSFPEIMHKDNNNNINYLLQAIDSGVSWMTHAINHHNVKRLLLNYM